MSLQEKFKAILASNDFEQLMPFVEPKAWDAMSLSERELLGLLFIKQGEWQFKCGDQKMAESLELAAKVAPQSAVIFFRQALVYAAQGQNSGSLTAAGKALQQAIKLDPAFVKAWHSWGNVLVRLGVFYEELPYFYQADEKFAEAARLLGTGAESESTLYWHWGLCWFHIGKQAGEASDFFRALAKFRLAAKAGEDSAEFNLDFGNLLVDMGFLMKDNKDFFLDAIDRYHRYTELEPEQAAGWLNLACTYQRLYDITGQSDDFQAAGHCFLKAGEIAPHDPLVWHSWGQLCLHSAKINRQLDDVKSAIEKLKTAHQLDPENPQLLMLLGESQMLVASYAEDLESLHEAYGKINAALKALPNDPYAWSLAGACLSELGRYFASDSYYLQAIEKFEAGLKLDATHTALLHGMALAYYALGELLVESTMIEVSITFFQRLGEKQPELPLNLLNDWGVALMKLGEMTNGQSYIEEAAEKFELAINRHLALGSNADIDLEWLYNYGCAMDFLGDFHEESVYYEKAVQVLSHVLQTEPGYPHVRYNLALALFHLAELNADIDSFQRSIELFHEIVQLDPEDDMAWNDYGLTLLNLAVLTNDPVHIEKGCHYFEQAECKLRQAIALGNEYAFYNLACLYALTDNVPAALHYMERAAQGDALPDAEELMHDEWLEKLREQPAFRLIISRQLSKEQEDEEAEEEEASEG